MAEQIPPWEMAGKGFSGQYYQCMAGDRNQLGGVYRGNTIVTWCGERFQGTDQIMTKICSLQFTQSQWKAEDIDVQPMPNNMILVVINGEVRIEGAEHSLRFNDVITMAQDQQGWHIQNQVFRILGGGGQ